MKLEPAWKTAYLLFLPFSKWIASTIYSLFAILSCSPPFHLSLPLPIFLFLFLSLSLLPIHTDFTFLYTHTPTHFWCEKGSVRQSDSNGCHSHLASGIMVFIRQITQIYISNWSANVVIQRIKKSFWYVCECECAYVVIYVALYEEVKQSYKRAKSKQ